MFYIFASIFVRNTSKNNKLSQVFWFAMLKYDVMDTLW